MKYSSKIEIISPEKAQEYLRYNTFNRPLDIRYVASLADQMARGQWKMNGEPVIFSATGYLLDGQHRLAAIVKSGVSVEMAVTRGVAEDSFVTIDTGRGRTAAAVFAIAGIVNYSNIAAGLAKLAMLMKKGESNLFSGNSRYKLDGRITRQDLLNEYYRSPELYQDICRMSMKFYKSGRLMSASEIFAMIAYLVKEKNHSLDKVETFFNALCCGTPCDCSAVNMYRNMLIRDKSAQFRMTPAVKRNLFAKTWNSYVQGKNVKRLSWSVEQGSIEFL